MRKKIKLFIINFLIWIIVSICMTMYFEWETNRWMEEWIKNNQDRLHEMPGDSFMIPAFGFSILFLIFLIIANIVWAKIKKNKMKK